MNQGTKLSVADYYDDTYGNTVYTLVAPSDVEIKQGGNTVTATETIGAYKKYVMSLPLSQEKNNFSFDAVKGDKTYGFTHYVGGKATVVSADQTSEADFKKEGVKPTVSYVNASTVNSEFTGTFAKVDLKEVAKKTAQSFNVRGKLIEGIDASTSKVIVHVYYEGEDNVPFVISAKHAKQTIYFDIANVKLKKGMNAIEINFAATSWEKMGKIEYVAMILGGKTGEPARTIYIADSVIYKK
jgi:hypothetical protein